MEISGNLFVLRCGSADEHAQRYSILNETLDCELFSYYDFEFDDALTRPRMLCDFSDSINLKFGVNIFI